MTTSDLHKNPILLGTRRSLLAMAQSRGIARQLEDAHPGLKVELVGIETQGDQILDKPLSEIEGKEFFVAELDRALLRGEVDFTVHSLKDLSLERPESIAPAVIPKRANARDVIIFSSNVIEKLQRGEPLKIGTSAPRRQENLSRILTSLLPVLNGQNPTVEFISIRGNVNSRLARLQALESETTDTVNGKLDGVVLALAGLSRLWQDETARIELTPLLANTRFMVLPLLDCPTAPGQGALAIECRQEDQATQALLKKLHDPDTARAIAREREILQAWGGGCHQKLGASAFSHAELGEILSIRGTTPSGERQEELRWNTPSTPEHFRAIVIGGEARSKSHRHTLPLSLDVKNKIQSAPCIFIAHSQAAVPSALSPHSRIWVSGTESWKKLAARGIWVEGCAESLGIDSIQDLLAEPLLQLAPLSDWVILTHRGATSTWSWGTAIATYLVSPPKVTALDSQESAETAETTIDLTQFTHLYWESGSHYDQWRDRVPSDLHHSCGPGKTATHLRTQGLNPTVFPNLKEWKKWIGLNS